jgi:glycosyltransferase involved in cell wall biosynthesis|tara:strand:+ start:990 stop:2183 length:1194 start_codon:yes stop_codon:yes gene_type:complete
MLFLNSIRIDQKLMAKKVLIVYFNNITPTDSGSKKLTFSHIKHLHENGFEITLFCCLQEDRNDHEISKYVKHLIEFDNPLNNKVLKVLNKLDNTRKSIPFDQNKLFKHKLSKALAPLYDAHDYILFHYVDFSAVLPQKVLDKSMVFTHDLMFYRLNEFTNKDGSRNAFIKEVKNKEVALLKRFKKVLVVADYEKEILIKEGIAADKIVDVGAPQEPVNLKEDQFENYFGFIGGNYSQNVEAIEEFIEKYYPFFQDKTFAIAGGVCKLPEVKKLASKYPNISLLGYVADLKEFYSSVRFITAALPVGSGIKIKVVEGMAHGKIILGTNKAYEGINPTNLTEAIVLEDFTSIEALKAKLIELEDEGNYHTLANGAKGLIKRRFGFDKLFKPLDDYMNEN